MNIYDIDKDKFFELLFKIADQCEKDAALGGSMHDGGASLLREQIYCYKAGIEGKIPKSWDKYIKEYNRQTDPEYAQYLELKKKFG